MLSHYADISCAPCFYHVSPCLRRKWILLRQPNKMIWDENGVWQIEFLIIIGYYIYRHQGPLAWYNWPMILVTTLEICFDLMEYGKQVFYDLFEVDQASRLSLSYYKILEWWQSRTPKESPLVASINEVNH
jgi:hypothetical protein